MLEGSTPAADAVLTAPPSPPSTWSSTRRSPCCPTRSGSSARTAPGSTAERSRTVTAMRRPPASACADLPDGTYLVSYRVVSADSHPVEGAYTFVIGHPSPAPAVAPPVNGSRSVDVALGISRWLLRRLRARTRRLRVPGLVRPAGWSVRRARLLVRRRRGAHVGTLLALLLKGPYDAGAGLGSATDGRLLREVLGTTYGRALDARLLLIAALVLLLTYREHVPARWLRGRAGRAAGRHRRDVRAVRSRGRRKPSPARRGQRHGPRRGDEHLARRPGAAPRRGTRARPRAGRRRRRRCCGSRPGPAPR